jgi:hypothetical protein
MPNLGGTPTHVTAVELYQRHHGDPAGVCVRCGERAPCPVRSHAESVIVAAGEDPRRYDRRLSPGAPAADAARPVGGPPAGEPDFGDTHAGHAGFSVGGRDVHRNPASFLYERDQ